MANLSLYLYFGHFWLISLFKEWEDTFYITARDAENNLEFFRCSDGELMEVEVKQ